VRVRSWQAAYRGLIPRHHLDGPDPVRRRSRWAAEPAGDPWPRAGTLVAELDDRIAGFATLCPTRDEDLAAESFGEIAAFHLAPDVWGRGVGRRLMAAAPARLAEGGYPRPALWVLDANRRARRFYEATGWRCDGTVKVDESRGFPLIEVRYRREVDAPGRR
jgi:Acetyltransferases